MRIFHRDRVRGAKAWVATVIATAFGAGLTPAMPGTMGTLVSVPITYFTNLWDVPARLAFWIVITAIGTWSAQVFDRMMDSKDNQCIVVDEVVGYGITAWTAGHNPLTLFVAFVLFRAFDIAKPFPVRNADRWSKKHARFSGFGVMLDDILAAFQGLIVILILQHFRILS